MRLLQRLLRLVPRKGVDVVPPALLSRRGDVKVSVGLDFGTHSTKVAYLHLGAGARVIKALSFGHGLEDWPQFALPAIGTIDEGALVWGVEAARKLQRRPWTEGIRRLKALIASRVDPRFSNAVGEGHYLRELEAAGVDPEVWQVECVAAAALALQMAAVHRELSKVFPGRHLDPQFTVPVPIDHVQHSKAIALYRRITNTAHALLAEDGSLRCTPGDIVPKAREVLQGAPESESPEGRVYTLPEAVAQMASYLTSLEAEHGIHGVIDIGAGTTDVNIFRLEATADGSRLCSWYAAEVIPLAGTFVLGRISDAIGGGNHISEADLVAECGNHHHTAREAFEKIRHETNRAWTSGFNHNRQQTAWEECPLFLSGGGALLPGAGEVFRRSWVPNWRPHGLRTLPTPRTYVGNGAPFGRMAVAYGLAIPGPEHGDFVLPNDCPDHTPTKRIKNYYDTDGDQTLPKPGWV